jgi:hypothetical protein
MNLIATTWRVFRRLVCLLFAVLLAGGACFTIWRFFQGNGALPNAIYSLAALGFAAWFAWFAVHDSALGRRMSAASDGAFPFYLGCAVMLGLSSFAGYLCVHGFLTDQAPTFSRYRFRWFSRAEHPGMFWVSIIFHASLGTVLLLSTLLVMHYRYKRGRRWKILDPPM